MATGGKYRRGKITTPNTVFNVVDFQFKLNSSFDRRSADDTMTGYPVKSKVQGSGSFTLCSGSWTDFYNGSLVAEVQDVTVVGADGAETVVRRGFTFTAVTSNSGMNANNDGGESSRQVEFEFGTVTESVVT